MAQIIHLENSIAQKNCCRSNKRVNAIHTLISIRLLKNGNLHIGTKKNDSDSLNALGNTNVFQIKHQGLRSNEYAALPSSCIHDVLVIIDSFI